MTDTSVADTGTGTGTSAADALGVGASPPPPPPFYDGFTDASLKDWAAKAQFKSPEDVAKIAHKFDAIKDQDPANLIAIPGADAKPEDHMAILTKLGVPQKPEDYRLTEIPGVDKDMASWAQGVAHKAGFLPWQMQILAKEQMAYMAEKNAKLIADDQAGGERETAQVLSEWGPEGKQKMESARRVIFSAAAEANVSKERAEEAFRYLETGIGVGDLYRILYAISKRYNESDFVDGAGGTQEPQGLGGGLLASYRATDASMRK